MGEKYVCRVGMTEVDSVHRGGREESLAKKGPLAVCQWSLEISQLLFQYGMQLEGHH